MKNHSVSEISSKAV